MAQGESDGSYPSGMRRSGAVGWLIVGVTVLIVGCLGLAVWVWNSSLSLDQRLVGVGDTLAAGGQLGSYGNAGGKRC